MSDFYKLWQLVGMYKLHLFKEEDIIIDIGMNIGDFSITACLLGCKNVISFEVSKMACEKAKINIENIGFSNFIKINNKAVWKSGVKEEVRYNKWEEGHETLIVNKTGDIIAESTSLDEILENLDIVKFLKVDCEYSEYPILMTSRLLSKKVKEIAIECHRLKDTLDNSPEELEEYLKKQGFETEHNITGDKGLSFIYAKNKNI
tara:strand:+ start:474 stop:1085 length:612 start_codon:yes stop_codon:yes gene_type:complete